MRKPLSEMVDDYFRSSPAWPMPAGAIDLDAEAAAFVRDESDHPADERYALTDVRAIMAEFVAGLAAAGCDLRVRDETMGTLYGKAIGNFCGTVSFDATRAKTMFADTPSTEHHELHSLEELDEAGHYRCYDSHGREWVLVDYEEEAELIAQF